MEEESSSQDSSSQDHSPSQVQPQAFFVLDNIPPLNQFDYWHNIPPINEDPIEFLASTSGELVESILQSILSIAGTLGGIYINLRGEGYVEIRPTAEDSWDIDSFPRLLRETLDEWRVPQGEEGDMVWHPTNLQSLFDGFPRNTRVLGCLLGDDGRDRYEIGLRACLEIRVSSDENIVFVVGNFLNYRELEERIDYYVQVSNHEVTPEQCISIICRECQQKWNLM